MTFDPAAELEKPFGDYSGLIAAWGQQRPDRVALDDGIESLTWARSRRWSSGLQRNCSAMDCKRGRQSRSWAPARCAMRWPIWGPFAPVAVRRR
jgi:hypothetical protein